MQLCAQDAIDQGFMTTSAGEKPKTDKNGSLDLTIGMILKKSIDGTVAEYKTACMVQPQETVYLISSELLDIKTQHTAYVFLKNRLSQKGVLAFNTGIIDEGYKGCISTLVTNLSSNPIDLRVGTEFFRVVIHRFECNDAVTQSQHQGHDVESYIENRKIDLMHFPESFLDREKIENEINTEINKKFTAMSVTRLTVAVAVLGSLFAIYAVFTPFIQGYFTVPTAKEVQTAFVEISNIRSEQEYIKENVRDSRLREEMISRELVDYKSNLQVEQKRIVELERRLINVEGRLGKVSAETFQNNH